MLDEEQNGGSATDDGGYEWPRLLGEISRKLTGKDYEGQFVGTGFVAGDYDEGSFLSDMPFTAKRRSWTYREKRRRLALEDMFPEGWNGAKVEYEITVRARCVRMPRRVRSIAGTE